MQLVNESMSNLLSKLKSSDFRVRGAGVKFRGADGISAIRRYLDTLKNWGQLTARCDMQHIYARPYHSPGFSIVSMQEYHTVSRGWEVTSDESHGICQEGIPECSEKPVLLHTTTHGMLSGKMRFATDAFTMHSFESQQRHDSFHACKSTDFPISGFCSW